MRDGEEGVRVRGEHRFLLAEVPDANGQDGTVRRGLIAEPRKPSGGQRRYPESAVRDLEFIRRAQKIGFTLEEIKELLRLADGMDRGSVRAITEQRRSRLVLHATQLATMISALEALLEKSRRHRGKGPDPIILALQAKAAAIE